MISLGKFFNNNQLSLSNQPLICKFKWVFIGVIPLNFLYVIKPFHKINCAKSLTFVCYLLQITHHNIYKFSINIGKLSLTKKTLANQAPTIWLPSYSLNLYSRKLHSINFNKICCSMKRMNYRNLHVFVLNI